VSKGLKSHSTHYWSFRRRFYRPGNTANSVKALKEASCRRDRAPIPLRPLQHVTVNKLKANASKHRHGFQCDKTQSADSCIQQLGIFRQQPTMQHELHDGIDWFTASTNTQQLHNVLVVEPFHHLSFAQEVQLQHHILLLSLLPLQIPDHTKLHSVFTQMPSVSLNFNNWGRCDQL